MEFQLMLVGILIILVIIWFLNENEKKDSKKVSKSKQRKIESLNKFKKIDDNFETLGDLQRSLRNDVGLESSELILAVDFTKSNEWQGKKSFGGRCLHDLSDGENPYWRVIDLIGRTLEEFDDGKEFVNC